MLQFIRLRPGGDFWVGAGFISDHRTASQLLSQREAARMVQNFVQPIILALAYGTCSSAKISCHSAGAWLYAHCAKTLPTSTNCAYPPIKFEVSTQY